MQRKALQPSRYLPLLMSMALGCATATEGHPPTEQPPGLIPDLVKDLNPGPTASIRSSSPGAFVSIGAMTFFIAQGEGTGYELWKSDGTAAGTVLVKDVAPGKDSGVDSLAVLGNTLFFAGGDTGTGPLLWKSDGTAMGTQRVSPAHVSGVGAPTACNGKLFFLGTDGAHGQELWRSDGTEAGTVLVEDGVPGPTGLNVNPRSISCLNGKLFFQQLAGNSLELWASDGSAEGTGPLVSGIMMSMFMDTWPPVPVGGAVFFTANDSLHGRELWTSDGTPAGTRMVKDIKAGSAGGMPDGFEDAFKPTRVMKSVGNTLFFLADDGVHGVELWASDGTEAGTRLVKDIVSGATSSKPVLLGGLNGEVLLQADDGVHGLQLWKSNGTEAGTRQVAERASGWLDPSGVALGEVDGALLFASGSLLRNLYRTDGTDAGTVLLQQLPEGALWTPPEGGIPPLSATLGNRLVFSSRRMTSSQVQLWVSNGTAAGTVPLATLTNTPAFMTRAGGYVVFQGDDEGHGTEPWVTDGTVEGTKVLRDIIPANSSAPESLVDVEGSLYFAAYDTEYGMELRKSDGTAEGTLLVKDINTGIQQRGPYLLTPVASQLFFFNQQPDFQNALWKTDGTEAGTVRVKQVPERAGEAAPLGTSLFFTVQAPSLGRELWKSDGTEAGTVLVKDINPGTGNASPVNLTAVGNTLYFSANDGTRGAELWKTDGTEAGTVLVQDIFPGAASGLQFVMAFASPSSRPPLSAINGVLYFAANDGVHGFELWKSNGTAEGTVLVKDVLPGFRGGVSTRSAFVAVGTKGRFAFVASDEAHGTELWMSDGTTGGTVQFQDIALGADSSSPQSLTVSGSRLLFTANDGVNGRELWSAKQALFQR